MEHVVEGLGAAAYDKYRILALAVMLVILPVSAESIYAPSLPALARSFAISEHLAEHTMTVYLLGSALGSLFWGQISDYLGRRPVVLLGYFVFLLSSFGCYTASSIEFFLCFRILQGFSGAISCMCQCINRDIFEPKDRIEISSIIGTVVSIAPALGSLLGGVIALTGNWRLAFLVLLAVGIVFFTAIYIGLPETKKAVGSAKNPALLWSVGRVFTDANLLVHALMIGLGLGIFFAFFSEGPFYFVRKLEGSAQLVSWIIALGALVYAGGCRLANRIIQSGTPYTRVMVMGLVVMLLAFTTFVAVVAVFEWLDMVIWSVQIMQALLAGLWLIAQLGLSFLLTPSFALALENQAGNVGIAASWFSFIYTMLNMLINAGMAYIHNDSLLTMPLYFLLVTITMAVFMWLSLDNKCLHAHNVAEFD